jgi:hypothetical protein
MKQMANVRNEERSMSAVLVVDDEQAKLIHAAPDGIEIRDRSGKHLGYVSAGFTPEEIALAQQRRRSTEPRHTTEQVLQRLRAASPS